MKKYILVLFILSFIFGFFNVSNITSVSADNSGCMTGDLFSRTTGQPCDTTTTLTECRPGDLFNSMTGKPCNAAQDNSSSAVSKFNNLFKNTFKIGTKGNDVKILQQFLKDEDYYFGKIDGKYGRITARAVKDFQDDNDIATTPIITIPPVVCPLVDVNGVAQHVCPPKDPVPPTYQSPVISGVSGPQSLNVNQQGTWTVIAYDTNKGIGNLSYSVLWGDEELGPQNVPIASSPLRTAEQNATFTHAYYYAGNFTPTFTVTNFGGQKAQTSLSVNVGGVSTNAQPKMGPIAVPSNISVGQSVKFNFSATDADNDDLSWSLNWGEGPGGTTTCAIVNSSRGSGQNWSYSESHAWYTAGAFLVKVYVTDCKGGMAETSFTVNVGGVTSNSITVLSPNGGETWAKGTTQKIEWSNVTCAPGFCGDSPSTYHDIKLIKYNTCTSSICPMWYSQEWTIAKNQLAPYIYWDVGKTLEDTVSEGSYKIEVCQTNSGICDSSNSYFKIVNGVATNAQPVLGPTAVPVNISVGQSVNFNFSATDADNDDLNWSINWGDSGSGGSCQTPNPQQKRNWTYNTSHTWNTAGSYLVKVSVTDCRGGTAETSFTVNVGGVSNTGIVVASLDASTPISTTLSPGQVGVMFSRIKLSNNSNNNVSVTLNNIQLSSDTIFADKFIQNIKIFNGSTQVGATASNVTWNGSYYYLWIPATLTIAPYTSTSLTLTADVLTTTNLGVTMRLGIAGLNFNAPGATVAGLPVYGNNMTIAPSDSSFVITTSSPLPNATAEQACAVKINTTGGTIGIGFSVSLVAGALPPGISWSPCSTSVCAGLTGTPTIPGAYTFMIGIIQGAQTATKAFSLMVNPAISSGGGGGGSSGGGTIYN